MRKTYIVKEAKDFENIIKKGKCRKNQSFVIHFKKNNLPYDKYGISVSKKLGNAVFRNKYKRKLRSIIDNYRKIYNNGEDYIIILRRGGVSDIVNLKSTFSSSNFLKLVRSGIYVSEIASYNHCSSK